MSTPKTKKSPFDPNDWASRIIHNADESERNSLQDSGWNEAFARNCTTKAANLLWELFDRLTEIEILLSDFFDRPELAAVLSAVALVSKVRQLAKE